MKARGFNYQRAAQVLRQPDLTDWARWNADGRPATITLLRRLKDASDGSPYLFLDLQRLGHIDARQQAGRPRPKELFNDLLRRFKTLQERAQTLLTERRGEDIDWPIGCFHDLRRTFACRAADVVPMPTLQEWMGHKDIATTATYYCAAKDAHAEAIRAAFSANKQPTPTDSADVEATRLSPKPASHHQKAAIPA